MDHEDIDGEPPLTRMAPERWDEARRRAQVVREYLLLPSPSMAETAAFAARLGLGRTQFRTLARTFSGQAQAAGRPGRHHASIEEGPEGEIDAALRRLGTDVRQDDLRAVVVASCARKGIEAPSLSTIRRRLIDARARDRMVGSPSGVIVLDHVELGVLCMRDGLLLRPSLVAAMDDGSTEILGHDVDVGAAADLQAARALLAGGTVENGTEALRMARDPARWCHPGRRLLADRLGQRIGRVPVTGFRNARVGDTATQHVALADLRLAIAQALGPSATRRKQG